MEREKLNSRTFFRTMHAMHPDEGCIRSLARVEDAQHEKECETPFSETCYEFYDYLGREWRQWICWCGIGTYVERVKG